MSAVTRLVLLTAVMTQAYPSFAQVTWSGTGANANWNTPGNWSTPLADNFNTGLVFAGTNLLSNTNTLTGGTATSLLFASDAGAFTLSGSSITLAGTITSSAAQVQNIDFGITLSGTVTMLTGTGTLVFNGPISGSGGIRGPTAAGTASVLRLTSSNSYTGDTSFTNFGRLEIGNAHALGSGTLRVTGNNASNMTITNVTGGDLTINNNFFHSGRTTISSTTGLLTIGGTVTTVGNVGSAFFQLSGSSQVAFETLAAGDAANSFQFSGFGAGSRLTIKSAAQPSLVARVDVNAPLALGSGQALGSGTINFNGSSADILPLISLTGANAIANDVFLGTAGSSYGRISVSGSNDVTFTGTTTVATLIPRVVNNLAPNSRLVLAGNIFLSDTSTTGRELGISGSGNTTFSGTIADFDGVGGAGGSLHFRDNTPSMHSGTTTITANNTYSGGTIIGGTGTVILGHNSALGTGPVTVSNAPTIQAAMPLANLANPWILGNNPTFSGSSGITFTGGVTGSGGNRVLTSSIGNGQLLTLSGTTSIRAGTDTTNRTLTVAGTGNTLLSGPIVNGGASGDGAITITNTGTTTLSGANTYTGLTTVSNGVVLLSTTAAVTGTAARPYTVNAGGALGSGFALNQDLLNKVLATSAGAVALGANSANTLDFSGTTNLTAASLGAVSGTWAYSGALTPSGTTYRLGGGGGTLDFQSQLTGATRTLVVGGNAAGRGGTVILSNDANDFTGKTTVPLGTLEFTSIGDVNAGASALGNPANATAGTIDLGTGTTSATLRYVGTTEAGHTSNRTINILNAVGTIDASGSGALDMSAGSVTAATDTTVTLAGTSAAANALGPIGGAGVNVDKTGPGLWRLTAASSFTGRLSVLEGTIRAAAGTGLDGSGVFGAATGDALLPLIGDATDSATGQAAVLLENNVLIDRGLVIAPLGSGATQEVILGSLVGTGTFGNGGQIRLGRDVTLQAATGGSVLFANGWRDSTGGQTPAVAFNVGAADNDGTVVFGSFLPDTISEVNVRQGTLRLDWRSPVDPNRGPIGFSTPVKLGGAGLGGTLNINEGTPEFGRDGPVQQKLSNLSFDGSDSTVTGIGTLRLFNSGSAAAVNVAGTGHTIGTAVALDDATTFTVADGGRLGIAGVISGSAGNSLTKAGPGILELTVSNTYTGPTIISGGRLVLGETGSFANSSAIIVGNAGSTDAVLDLTSKTGGFTFGAGQTLGGGGRIELASSGTLTVAGLFSPGNSPGLFTYNGGSTLLSGTTLMEIFGTTRAELPSHESGVYDAVDVINGGILTFGGLLQLEFSSLFDTDTTFNLFSPLDTASLAGNFTSVSVTGDFYTGLDWTQPTPNLWKSSDTAGGQSLEFNATTGTLVIVVPEPGSLALAGLGLAAAAYAARRQSSRSTRMPSRGRRAQPRSTPAGGADRACVRWRCERCSC